MASGKARSSKNRDEGEARKAWEPMTLTYVGDATEVVRGGGGKLTATSADPGEPRKPSSKPG